MDRGIALKKIISKNQPVRLLHYFGEREEREMADLWWGGALVLTFAGALLYWGARVFEVESFYTDSSASLGLALVLVGLAQI